LSTAPSKRRFVASPYADGDITSCCITTESAFRVSALGRRFPIDDRKRLMLDGRPVGLDDVIAAPPASRWYAKYMG
jgi:hypothetical protein